MQRQILMAIVYLFVATLGAYAQSGVVTGTVRSADDGGTLPGVNVVVKGTTVLAITDLDGKYSINVPSGGTTLVFSYIGFRTQEVAIAGRPVVDVSLVVDTRQLDELIVTAFGVEQERKSLGYAVQEVRAASLMEAQQPNLVNALQGKVAGVQITNSGGAPGAASVIMIRGGTSLSGNNQPLFIVDGIPIDNSAPVSRGVGLGAQNTVNSNRGIDINPEDIESITILKGPAAAVLYGLRASEGAVIITTKRGQAGVSRVTYSNGISFDVVNRLPELQGRFKQGVDGVFNPDARSSWGPEFNPGESVFDNLGDFFQTAQTSRHDLSVSGGTNRSTFYMSTSRYDQVGIIKNTDFERTSFRVSADTRIFDNLTVGGSANYVNTQNSSALQGSGVAETNIIGATGGGGGGTMRGIYNWPRNVNMSDYLNPDGSQKTLLGVAGDAAFIDNPYWSIRNNPNNSTVNRLIAALSATYNPLDFMTITYRAGTDFYNEEFTSVRGTGTVIGGEERGAITENSIFNEIVTSTLLVTLRRSLSEDISATLTLGNNIEMARRVGTSWYGRNFIAPGFASINNVAQTDRTVSQSGYNRRIVGAFGDLNMDWKNVVFLNVRGRNDWSSTLPKDARSFFYPSVSTSIVVTDLLDEFGVDNGYKRFLSFAKLRASVTRVGKDAPPHVLGNRYFNTTNSFTAAPRGFIVDTYAFGSPDLRPEYTESFEVGMDLRLYEGRIGVDFTYYSMSTDDQILFTRVPPSASSFIAYLNGGRIDNEGIELMINASPISRRDFKWDVDFNFTKNTSKVVDLPGLLDRVEQSDASVDGFVAQGAGFLGQSLFGINADVWLRNADGVLLLNNAGYPQINSLKQVVGDRNPDFTIGFTNTMNYKNLSLSFLWDIRIGGDIYNATENALVRSGLSTKTLDRGNTVVFDGIIASTGQPSTIAVPLNQNYYQNIFRGNAQAFVEDGSWYRLRYVTLKYRVPQRSIERYGLKGLELTATGRNLLLFTNYSGVDPEVSSGGSGVSGTGSMGMDNLGVPGTRGFDFGLRLSL
jgi:TonB-linked SusC/RagA family outer membrane protein